MENSQSRSLDAAARPRDRRWIWLFAILAVLASAAIVIQIWYNSQQQLTQEQLDNARSLWSQKGPPSYEMKYLVKKVDGVEEFAVDVENGAVVKVKRNNELLEPRLFRYYSMTALFGQIDDFLRIDIANAQGGKSRPFTIARFDSQDGHLQRFVRSVNTQNRIEILVLEFRNI
jgi:hypothetical protein